MDRESRRGSRASSRRRWRQAMFAVEPFPNNALHVMQHLTILRESNLDNKFCTKTSRGSMNKGEQGEGDASSDNASSETDMIVPDAG